ncbi:MAG: hypothetical protein JO165_12030, partial [Candidatus Eremiobacteraeota bacterium]|nr:hypothetical protein [Candidatus Eremiobacteraeota bacterium]
MDATEARNHLETANTILARVPRLARPSASMLIAWGCFAAFVDILTTLVANGRLPVAALWLNLAAFAAAVGFSINYTRRISECESVAWVDIQLGRLFGAAFVAGLIASFGIGPASALHPWVASAIWNTLFGAILLFVGFCGDRLAAIAGVIIVVAVPIGAYAGNSAGYVL